MASVQKYGSGYSVRYWYESETGERKMKRVSGFATKEAAWAAAQELEDAFKTIRKEDLGA